MEWWAKATGAAASMVRNGALCLIGHNRRVAHVIRPVHILIALVNSLSGLAISVSKLHKKTTPGVEKFLKQAPNPVILRN